MRIAKFLGLSAALSLLLTAGNEGHVGLAQGQEPPVRTLGFGEVLSVALCPDGRYLVAGEAASDVHLIDTTSLQVMRTFEGHTDCVTSVAFSPDGRLLALGSMDGPVKLWDIGDLMGR